MAYEQIIYEVADNIATITLNRPEKLNAFTGIMMNEMLDAFDVDCPWIVPMAVMISFGPPQ